MVREILLGNGRVAIVDDEDYEKLSHYVWWHTAEGNTYYAYKQNDRRSTRMHRMILEPAKGLVVDHINGDGLDNRRCNLRICTQSENMRNHQIKRKNVASKFYGVSWESKRGKWRASVYKNNKRCRHGYFEQETEAAKIRDVWALEVHGPYVKLNFPTGEESL